MPTLTLSAQDPASVAADAVVVGVVPGPAEAGPRLVGAEALPDALRATLHGSLEALGVTGAADTVHRIPTAGALQAPVLVLTGLGGNRTGAAVEPL